MFLKQLQDLVNGEKSKYTVQELLDHFESSSIVVCLVLATFITSIPLPPWGGGFETIPGGLLSIFIALQGLLGREQVYIPPFLRSFEIDIKFIQKSDHTKAAFQWIESHIQPDRYTWGLNKFTETLMYLLVIPNALLMLVPIMFTNGPPSQCITLMALSWLLYDGFYFLIMLATSTFVILMYIVLFIVFSKFLYRTRKTWTFGLWK